MNEIIDVNDLLDEDGSPIMSLYEPLFVDPKCVVGIDYETIKIANKKCLKSHDNLENDDELIDHPDEILWEIISIYLSQHEDQKTLTLNRLLKSFNAVIFLVNKMYCSPPVFTFGMYTTFLTKDNVSYFLDLSITGWQEADGFAKVLLAEMYFEFFDIVFCRYVKEKSKQHIPVELLNLESQNFLNEIRNYPMLSKGNVF